jgi:hypothetical protein
VLDFDADKMIEWILVTMLVLAAMMMVITMVAMGGLAWHALVAGCGI